MPATVSLDDLEQALFWVSSPPGYECTAHISRSTGRIFFCNADGPVDSDVPDDLDDGTQYLALPRKNELELDRTLVLRFADEFAPHLIDEVREIFRRRGAYARFKALMQRHRMLDLWHDHERRLRSEPWSTGLRNMASSSSVGTPPDPLLAPTLPPRCGTLAAGVRRAMTEDEPGDPT